MARPAYSVSENEGMRERLADGALLLFRNAGAEGVSLRKLAAYMGMSHTLLYRYFENKEALFTSIRVESINTLHGMLLSDDDPTQPLEIRARAAAQALIRYGTEFPKEYRFVFASDQPDLDSNQHLLRIRHQVFDHMVNMVDGAAEHESVKMDARVWVHLAWAMLHGMLILNDNQQLVEGCSFDDMVESALELLFR